MSDCIRAWENCESHWDDADVDQDSDPDDDCCESCGSCDRCGCDIYPSEYWDGLHCDECAYLVSLGEGSDDAGCSGVL